MDGRQRLAALIAAEHPEPYREDLGTITGARSDLEIAAWIDELVRQELGCGTGGALFGGQERGSGVRAGADLRRAGGSEAVHPMFPPTELQAKVGMTTARSGGSRTTQLRSRPGPSAPAPS